MDMVKEDLRRCLVAWRGSHTTRHEWSLRTLDCSRRHIATSPKHDDMDCVIKLTQCSELMNEIFCSHPARDFGWQGVAWEISSSQEELILAGA